MACKAAARSATDGDGGGVRFSGAVGRGGDAGTVASTCKAGVGDEGRAWTLAASSASLTAASSSSRAASDGAGAGAGGARRGRHGHEQRLAGRRVVRQHDGHGAAVGVRHLHPVPAPGAGRHGQLAVLYLFILAFVEHLVHLGGLRLLVGLLRDLWRRRLLVDGHEERLARLGVVGHDHVDRPSISMRHLDHGPRFGARRDLDRHVVHVRRRRLRRHEAR